MTTQTEIKPLPTHHLLRYAYENQQDFFHGSSLHGPSQTGNSLSIIRGAISGLDYVRKISTSLDYQTSWNNDTGPNDVHFCAPAFPRDLFVEVICWADHSDATDREEEQRVWSMVMKYYNGGDLKAVRNKCSERWKEVPEWFIWYLVSRLSRAIAFLLSGWRDNADERDEAWIPLMHRDFLARNIFLHWENEEDHVPQIILGDFGMAARISDTVFGAGQTALHNPRLEEDVLEEWEDVQGLGKLLCFLVNMGYDGNDRHTFERYLNEAFDNHDDPATDDEEEEEEDPNDAYSDDLKQLIRKLWLPWNDITPGSDYPDCDYLINTILPLADRKFAEFKRSQFEKRPIKFTRPVLNNKLFFVTSPLDLFGNLSNSTTQLHTRV